MSRFIIAFLGSLLVIAPIAAAQPQYKKAHRNALARIVDGQAGAVAKQMRKRMATDPSDSEDWFMLAVALTKLGRLEEAVRAVGRAQTLGFPEERLATASVDWLRKIADREPLAALRLRMKNRVLMGPMVGHVTADEVRIWVRTLGEAKVTANLRGIFKADESRTVAANDYTAVLRFHDLQPNTRYGGTVSVNDQSDPHGQFSFKTPTATGSRRAPFTLAFGGGAGFTPQYERMWDTIGRARPDFMLLLGDNVYIDHPSYPDVQRFSYHRRQASAPYRRLLQHTPTWSIWDDHDFGTNDCRGGANIESRPWKRAVHHVFQSNWANPGYGFGGDHIGCWYDFHYGPAHFFMLDGRTWRTNPKRPVATMLGPVQKKWLLKELRASKAMFKVICSPVPWAKGTKPGSKDTWDGFPEERAEIFDFLADNGIEGVVLMSADRHRSDAWLIKRKNAYDLYEFNSSRLTNIHTHKTMKRALLSYNRTPSFGLVHFDAGGDPKVTYEVVTIDGLKVHRLEVKLSQLK